MKLQFTLDELSIYSSTCVCHEDYHEQCVRTYMQNYALEFISNTPALSALQVNQCMKVDQAMLFT